VKITDFRMDIVPRLTDLAEALDRKPPGDAALRVWWSVLEPLPVFPVSMALQQWSRSKTRFPAPSDIFEAANEIDGEERERRLANEAEKIDREYRFMGATEQGRETLRLIRGALATATQRSADPKAWARKILDRYVDGDVSLPDLSFRFACEALGRSVDDIRSLRDASRRALAEISYVHKPA
jgi:hypothetical protein